MAWFPMHTVSSSKEVDHHFISTDDPRLAAIGEELGVKLIERPDYLATSEALGEDAFFHGYKEIKSKIGCVPEFLILLFCNAPTFTVEQISRGIQMLRDDPNADSAVTVSRFNMYSPVRARRINGDGYLDPYIPFEHHPVADEINCDRDSQGDVWFADDALSIVRPQNLENLSDGLLPQKWMGKRILPIENEAGLDIDYPWQLGQIEWWIKKFHNGL
jgi:hypothetical protein